jgi:hypothetical protein
MPTPPIYFPPGGGQPPLGIWGPPGPWPSPPIAPGGPPPVAGWTPPGYHPAHPIMPVLPSLPGRPPNGGDGYWAWSPQWGWIYVPGGSGDKPHPPQPPENPDTPPTQPPT